MNPVKLFFSALVVIILIANHTQAQTLPALDVSPADIAYMRVNGKRSTPVIRVVYGRPLKKGRTMLGEKEPFGKVWRTGANETTEIKFFKDVTVGDKLISAGTYSLYTLPDKNEWTIILNTKLDTWGAFEYDDTKDIARIKVSATKADAEVEAFTIAFEGANGTGAMVLSWENTIVRVPLKY